MILYFSATGNSEYAAKYLADLLGDPDIVSLNLLIRSGRRPRFSSKRPYVILSPVYISSIPDVVLNLLYKSSFSGNKKIYFIMTCVGTRSASGYFAKKFCERKRLRYMGTVHLSMPQDYLIYFRTKPTSENRKKIKKTMREVPVLADYIRRKKPFPEKKPGMLHAMLIRPVSVVFQKYFIRPEKFYADDRCISCGVCERACPLNNIRIKNGRPVWGETCVHCTACINRCPKKAIEYGKITKGKLRYTAPRYHSKKQI